MEMKVSMQSSILVIPFHLINSFSISFVFDFINFFSLFSFLLKYFLMDKVFFNILSIFKL